jgi:hypothetical protein
MTANPADPRTALAEAVADNPWKDLSVGSQRIYREHADAVADGLAERGVLLVTEVRLAAAVDDAIGDVDPLAFGRSTKEQAMRETAAAIFAALSERQESAAVEGPDPYSGSANDPCACGHPLREHTLDDQDAGLCLHPVCSCDEFIEPEGAAAVEGTEPYQAPDPTVRRMYQKALERKNREVQE